MTKENDKVERSVSARLPGLDKVHRAVVGFCLRYRFLLLAISLAILAYALTVVGSSAVDVFPEFAPPQIEVQTESMGLSTSDVEKLVTVPLEMTLNGLPGLQDMRSSSVPQLSSIMLIFKPGTDVFQARQLVQERLATVRGTLPTWAGIPRILPPVSATGRVLQIGMSSDTTSTMALSDIALWRIKPRLLRIKGVADVAVWNERLPTYQLQIDPAKAKAAGVTLAEVEQTLSNALDTGGLQYAEGSSEHASGFIETQNQRLSVSQELPIPTLKDLESLPLERKASSGPTLTVGDVGTVVIDHQPVIGDAIVNGKPGLLLVVEKLPWGNTLNITKEVDTVIEQLKPGLPGVTFDANVFRPANFVDESINNLLISLLIGFVLVCVVLVLFLSEWRSALIALITIPLSTAAALVILHLMGVGINTMVIAGLAVALGDNVDDSVIDVENILRRLRQARTDGREHSLTGVIRDASVEIRNPIIFSTLIDVIAIAPIFLLSGLVAAFFQPLVLSYAICIVASMVISLTITPPLTYLLLRNAPVEDRKSRLADWLREKYQGVLTWTVPRPVPIIAGFVLVLSAGLVVAPFLGESLFPEFKQRDFLIHWVATPGTSNTEVERTSISLSKELKKIPGVRSFANHIGRARNGEEIVAVNFAEAWVSIDPKADYEATLDQINKVVDGYPGLYRNVETYLNERIEEVLAGSQAAITIRIYGSNLNDLRATADDVIDQIGDVKGVKDPNTSVSDDSPQIRVKVNVDKAAAYGLKPGDVRRQAASVIAGLQTGNVFKDNRWYPVIVWSKPSARDSVGSVGGAILDTPKGGTVSLSQIASVTIEPDPVMILRENGSRYLDVQTNVDGRDLGSVAREIQERLKAVELPTGAHYELLGEFKERQETTATLFAMAFVAILVIFLMFRTVFGSWRLAVLLSCMLPVSIVGGLFGVWVSGGIISIGALVGFFTVFGLAQGNGILMINHCQYLEREEGEPWGRALVIRGAKERLSPILMTSLATGLALLPLLFYGDQPGREIEHPLAVVIISGLFTATLATLFVLPTLYLRFGKSKAELEGIEAETMGDRD